MGGSSVGLGNHVDWRRMVRIGPPDDLEILHDPEILLGRSKLLWRKSSGLGPDGWPMGDYVVENSMLGDCQVEGWGD